jgi:magnesium transporter
MTDGTFAAEAATAESGLCLVVSILQSGETVRREGVSPSDIASLEASSTMSWVDCTVEWDSAEFDSLVRQLGFVNPLSFPVRGDAFSYYEDFGDEIQLKLPMVKVRDNRVDVFPLVVLIKATTIVTIHPTGVSRFVAFSRYAEAFLRKIPSGVPACDKVTLMLVRILDENNTANFEHLREIEKQGDALSSELTDTEKPPKDLGPRIYKMKHSLIRYLDTLWAVVDVLNSVRNGDAELLSDDPAVLKKFSDLVGDVNQEISLTEHLSDVLASGMEVLQSIYNNQLQMLNNRLALVTAYLTILGTAALVPNTIATIMGNTAFALVPSDRLWYIVLLAGTTIAATYAAYRWTKKRGLLKGVS